VHPLHIRSRELDGEFAFSDSVGSGSLVIPVRSLHGDTPLHGIQLRRVINARRYPTVEATVRRLTGADAEGDITFFGATVAAQGPIVIEAGDDDILITGEASFDVRDFGLDPPNVLGVKVHPEITVRIEVVAVRQ
jgi:hypothetical protein